MSRKTIIWGSIGAVAVAAIAGYSIIWQQIASNIKTQISTYVEKANSEDASIKLRYESMETRGFPFAFDTTLVKPAFDITVKDTGTTPTETISIAWDESLHVTAPVIGKSVSITNKGPIRVSGTRNAEALPALLYTADDKNGCRFDTHNLYAFNQDSELFVVNANSKFIFSEEIAGIHCDFNGLNVSAADDKQTLLKADRLLLAFLNNSQDDAYTDGQLELRARNFTFPAEAAASIDKLNAAYGLGGSENYGLVYTKTGTINFDLLASAKGRDDDIHVQLSELKYRDNVIEFNGNADINNSLPDAYIVKAEFISQFKPQYDALMSEALKLTIFESLKQPMVAMMMPGVAQYVENIPEADRTRFMQDIMPSYERLGKLVIALDMTIPKREKAAPPAAADAAPAQTRTPLDIKRFEVSTNLGGLSVTAHSNDGLATKLPENVQAVFTCLKCTGMVDEMFAYQNDLVPHLQAAAPETMAEAPLPDSITIEAFKSFLQGAAKDPKANDLIYEVVVTQGAIEVNSKPIEELSLAFLTDVVSQMPIPETEVAPEGAEVPDDAGTTSEKPAAQ